jgi:hypothetical protein
VKQCLAFFFVWLVCMFDVALFLWKPGEQKMGRR